MSNGIIQLDMFSMQFDIPIECDVSLSPEKHLTNWKRIDAAEMTRAGCDVVFFFSWVWDGTDRMSPTVVDVSI